MTEPTLHPDSPDIADAEESLSKMKYWESEKKAVEDHANEQIEKAERWKKKHCEVIDEKLKYHTSIAFAYLEASGKKSVKLINGSISSRVGGYSVAFVKSDGVTPDRDRELFLNWAINNRDDLVVTEVKTKVNAKDVLKAIKEDGEEFPFTDLVQSAKTFKVLLY